MPVEVLRRLKTERIVWRVVVLPHGRIVRIHHAVGWSWKKKKIYLIFFISLYSFKSTSIYVDDLSVLDFKTVILIEEGSGDTPLSISRRCTLTLKFYSNVCLATCSKIEESGVNCDTVPIDSVHYI